jgi:hypothetical protein
VLPVFALLLSQAAPAAPAENWPTLVPQPVRETVRLASSPVIDGKIEAAEWEPFSEDATSVSNFQWEPGQVYWSATADLTHAVVFSFDGAGDGWLVGDDNFEIRASLKDGNVQVVIRRLDATNPNGPKWADSAVPPQALRLSSRVVDKKWEIEGGFDLRLAGLNAQQGGRAGVRIDSLPAGTALGPAYVPRSVAFLRYSLDSSRGLFSGLTWKPFLPERVFSRDDELFIRYDFQVPPEVPLLRGFSVQGEGPLAENVVRYQEPFPALKRDRTARIEYKSRLSTVTATGYRVIRATLTAADGTPCILRTSIRIADQVDLEPEFPATVEASSDARIVKAKVEVRSVTRNRATGDLWIKVPDNWTVIRGQNSGFSIVRPRGSTKLNVEFIVPKGTRGVFPIELIAKMGDKAVTKVTTIRVL